MEEGSLGKGGDRGCTVRGCPLDPAWGTELKRENKSLP